MNASRENKHRLFFALWPDDVVRMQLACAADHWTRCPVAAANLHMTLVFLGGCTAEELQCSRTAAAGVVAEGFELTLDCLGGWSRARVQWLGPSGVPAVLPELVVQLQQVLAGCGFALEQRPYVPHVTLARKVRKPESRSGLEAVHWPVRDFVLVESVSVRGGVEYRVLDRWPLK